MNNQKEKYLESIAAKAAKRIIIPKGVNKMVIKIGETTVVLTKQENQLPSKIEQGKK